MTRPEGSTPVFVDATGRRRRRVRRIAYAVGAACLTYTGLVGATVIGHTARPAALSPLPAPDDRPLPAVRQTHQPQRPLTGVPAPAVERREFGAAPVRLRRRAPDKPSPPPPVDAPAPPRTESTPVPAPPPTPTSSDPPEPTPPEPVPTDPPEPEPTQPPTPEPPPEAPQQELPVLGPLLDLLTGGSVRR